MLQFSLRRGSNKSTRVDSFGLFNPLPIANLDSLSPLQILPSGDLTKGPGGFFNATLTLDANREDSGGGGLLGRYICLGWMRSSVDFVLFWKSDLRRDLSNLTGFATEFWTKIPKLDSNPIPN